MKKARELAPTLWRTCRVLMNEVRLDLFRTVFEHDDKLNVSQIARLLAIDQPIATCYLRQLNARGLIGVRREKISVFYNTSPDRTLPEALKLRNAFFEMFAKPLPPDWEVQTMVLLKAYTHFNRLAIIIHLAEHREATAAELEQAMGVCVKSVSHHMHFLTRAKVVEERRSGKDAKVYTLCPQDGPVARALLDIVLQGAKHGRDYVNHAKGTEKDLRLIKRPEDGKMIIVKRKRI